MSPEEFPKKPDKNNRPVNAVKPDHAGSEKRKKSSANADSMPVKNVPSPNDSETPSSPPESPLAPPVGMSQNAQKVWNSLTAVPKHFHDLMAELGMDSSLLSRCITELELYGAVRTMPGNKYSKG